MFPAILICMEPEGWSHCPFLFKDRSTWVIVFVVLQLADKQMTLSLGWRSAQARPSLSCPKLPRQRLWSLTTRWQSSDSLRYDSDLSRSEYNELNSSRVIFVIKLLLFVYIEWTPFCCYHWGSLGQCFTWRISCVCRMLTRTLPRLTKKQLKPLMKFPSPWPPTMVFTPSLRCPRTVLSSLRRWLQVLHCSIITHLDVILTHKVFRA